jgi:hypothetical protein
MVASTAKDCTALGIAKRDCGGPGARELMIAAGRWELAFRWLNWTDCERAARNGDSAAGPWRNIESCMRPSISIQDCSRLG